MNQKVLIVDKVILFYGSLLNKKNLLANTDKNNEKVIIFYFPKHNRTHPPRALRSSKRRGAKTVQQKLTYCESSIYFGLRYH